MALFFFADTASIPYTGYGRFLAYSLIAVCGAVFASTYRSAERERALIVLCAVIAVLQLPAVTRMFTLDFQPDYERNSLEWDRSLIRLPVRTLAEKIATTQGGEQVRRIRMITLRHRFDQPARGVSRPRRAFRSAGRRTIGRGA